MPHDFSGQTFYKLVDMLDEEYRSMKLNGFTDEQARANAIANLQNKFSTFSRRWEDSKINEKYADDGLNEVMNGKGGTF